MKKVMTIFGLIFLTSTIITSCRCSSKKSNESKERYTTCDCADLTYELYQEYDKIIFSDMGMIKKGIAMRKTKKELKKDERYKFCREQGVRPLSIVYYPKNKKIFASCESWIKMEEKIDGLWKKIKDKINGDRIEDAEEE